MDVDYKIDQLLHTVCHHELDDLKAELLYVFEAALRQSGLARNQLEVLEGKIEDAVALLQAPPTEEDIALHHPNHQN